jgi:hypothetical protein
MIYRPGERAPAIRHAIDYYSRGANHDAGLTVMEANQELDKLIRDSELLELLLKQSKQEG